jgi:hypothetical protein
VSTKAGRNRRHLAPLPPAHAVELSATDRGPTREGAEAPGREGRDGEDMSMGGEGKERMETRLARTVRRGEIAGGAAGGAGSFDARASSGRTPAACQVTRSLGSFPEESSSHAALTGFPHGWPELAHGAPGDVGAPPHLGTGCHGVGAVTPL